MLGKKGEVVTRQVYENVRLDHLLSKEHDGLSRLSKQKHPNWGKKINVPSLSSFLSAEMRPPL